MTVLNIGEIIALAFDGFIVILAAYMSFRLREDYASSSWALVFFLALIGLLIDFYLAVQQ